jgi:hypothetical protein
LGSIVFAVWLVFLVSFSLEQKSVKRCGKEIDLLMGDNNGEGFEVLIFVFDEKQHINEMEMRTIFRKGTLQIGENGLSNGKCCVMQNGLD